MNAKARRPFKVGDEVNVRLGSNSWRARIVEDRGPIGVNGRRIYRVPLDNGADSEARQFVEVPEEDLTPLQSTF